MEKWSFLLGGALTKCRGRGWKMWTNFGKAVRISGFKQVELTTSNSSEMRRMHYLWKK